MKDLNCKIKEKVKNIDSKNVDKIKLSKSIKKKNFNKDVYK
ncbi:hypothetical protein [uncultured Mediterranean phage uvMED]|nr:hypothetical protein [uncultured Mediterranean phage uvMED]